MKVYVDKIPNNCFECPCFRDDIECCCGLDDDMKDYHKFTESENCPLQNLTDHDKEVRKQVCDKIRNEIFDYLHCKTMDELEELNLLNSTLTYDVVTDKLEEIEKEK